MTQHTALQQAISRAQARDGHPAKIGAPTRARARALPRGTMNALEQRYAQHLDLRALAGEVLGWRFEKVTFLLAGDVRYTPDFEVRKADGTLEYHDCKGTTKRTRKSGESVQAPWVEEDARIKIRVAAHEMPWHRFCLVFERGTKQSPIWSSVEVSP
jgi:hypothetical protein